MAKSVGENILAESFLHMAGQMYPGHTFAIEEYSVIMDGVYLCDYTIDLRNEELRPDCINKIDAEVEAFSEQFNEIERLTGFERETAWANL